MRPGSHSGTINLVSFAPLLMSNDGKYRDGRLTGCDTEVDQRRIKVGTNSAVLSSTLGWRINDAKLL